MLSETEWNGVNWNEEYYIGIYLSVDILVHFTHPFLYMSFTTKKIIIFIYYYYLYYCRFL